MTENEAGDDKAEGSVVVHVSARAVHKAVRNVMQNEMRIDADRLKAEAIEAAKAIARERVDQYLQEHGYDKIGLDARVKRYADTVLTKNIDDMLRTAIRLRANEFLQEQGLSVVEALVQQGIELKVGWNKTIKVKTTEAT